MGKNRPHNRRKTFPLSVILLLFIVSISLGVPIAIITGCGGGSGGSSSINDTLSGKGTSSSGAASRALMEPPQISLAKCYGGSSSDMARTILGTDDGVCAGRRHNRLC
jgi:hypothetical protein